MFFSKNKPLVGLDIGSSSVKAVELAKSKSGYEVVGFRAGKSRSRCRR